MAVIDCATSLSAKNGLGVGAMSSVTTLALSLATNRAAAARCDVENPRDVPVSSTSRLRVLTSTEYRRSATGASMQSNWARSCRPRRVGTSSSLIWRFSERGGSQ